MEWLNTFGAIVTAISTVLLTVVTWRLVNLGAEQSQTTQAQLRAYVHIQEAHFHWGEKDQRWRADFRYSNSGQTPAYDVVVSADLLVADTGADIKDWPVRTTWPLGTIGANGEEVWDERWFTEINQDTAAKDALTDALQQGTKEAFLHGRIDYRDVFGQARWTTFRYVSGGELGYIEAEMSSCKTGNATEWSDGGRKTR